MLDKKLTRKEFLLSVLSITAVFALSKIPNMVKEKLPLSKLNNINNAYGNNIYGGKNIA